MAEYVYGAASLDRDTTALILAVPEPALLEVAVAFAAQGAAPDGCAAFHLSGAVPSDVLEPLHHQGYDVGCFHPLVSVLDARPGVDRLGGSWAAVTGGPEAVRTARRLADALGMSTLPVPAGRRALYHAAVVMASSYLLPLLDLSVRLMERAGVDGDDALAALVPLARSTLAGIEEGGIPDSLRGPIPRGDVETTALHLRALDDQDKFLYALIGAEVLRLTSGDLSEETQEAMTDILKRYGGLDALRVGEAV
jgi:predicted short-subunit dehydrogenase-like oxidoreductase (DUF2520 family)